MCTVDRGQTDSDRGAEGADAPRRESVVWYTVLYRHAACRYCIYVRGTGLLPMATRRSSVVAIVAPLTRPASLSRSSASPYLRFTVHASLEHSRTRTELYRQRVFRRAVTPHLSATTRDARSTASLHTYRTLALYSLKPIQRRFLCRHLHLICLKRAQRSPHVWERSSRPQTSRHERPALQPSDTREAPIDYELYQLSS